MSDGDKQLLANAFIDYLRAIEVGDDEIERIRAFLKAWIDANPGP